MHLSTADKLPSGWAPYPWTTTGYRVNYSPGAALRSMLVPSHNEFWMIWTDVAPAALFACATASFYHSEIPNKNQCSERYAPWMFCAAIFCRVCSLLYHTFNCVSIRMGKILACLDLIGIASNAWGVPWVACMASFGGAHHQIWQSTFMQTFFAMYLECIAAIALSYAYENTDKYRTWIQRIIQCMLVALAAIGNFPTAYAVLYNSGSGDTMLSPAARALLAAGPVIFAAGYATFYVYRLPEAAMPPGSADGKIWNSHVLWHIASSTGQMCFILAVLYS